MLKSDTSNINSKNSSNSNHIKDNNKKISFNYIRYAHRPRVLNEKSLESFDSSSFVYQINDRSCQTSLELLEPIVENVLKRRKLTETTSLIDENEINNNNDGINNRKNKDDLIDTKSNDSIKIKNSRNAIGLFQRSLKILTKTSNFISLLKNSDKESSPSSTNLTQTENFNLKRPQFLNTKPKLNLIIEKENSMYSDEDINEKIELKRLDDDFEKNSFSARKGSDSECEKEFTNKMIQEDESLENFKKILIPNNNMVVNWDYVQSSDYL